MHNDGLQAPCHWMFVVFVTIIVVTVDVAAVDAGVVVVVVAVAARMAARNMLFLQGDSRNTLHECLLLLTNGLERIAAIDSSAAASLVEHLPYLSIAHQSGGSSSGRRGIRCCCWCSQVEFLTSLLLLRLRLLLEAHLQEMSKSWVRRLDILYSCLGASYGCRVAAVGRQVAECLHEAPGCPGFVKLQRQYVPLRLNVVVVAPV